jgi:hypothetical protein
MPAQWTLQQLADREEIRELLYRYCRAVYRIDAPMGHSVWHRDGTADYGEAIYIGTGRGAIDLICQAHRGMLNHSHQVTNITITLDGDRAASESYVFATLRLAGEGSRMQGHVWGRYLDRWSRRDGRWGIDHRVCVIDFDEVRPVTAMHAPQGRGRRDGADPSYAVLDHRLPD